MHNIKKNNSEKNNYTLKKLIFPPLAKGDLSSVKIDDESIKYVTFYNSAQEITNIIMNNLDDFPCPDSFAVAPGKWDSLSLLAKMSELVITEMTAGIGGNILNFANYFKYVNGIEIDPVRCAYLKSNIELYEFLNVNYYNDDSVKLLIDADNIVQDIIFFDPPWGGKNYKTHVNLKLFFGYKNESIENICKSLLNRPRNKMIVLKLPNNYDFDYFVDELKAHRVILYKLDRMTIVVVKNGFSNIPTSI